MKKLLKESNLSDEDKLKLPEEVDDSQSTSQISSELSKSLGRTVKANVTESGVQILEFLRD